MRHQRGRFWIAVLTAVVLFVGSIAGAVVFRYQRPPVVSDETGEAKESPEGGKGGSGDAEPMTALFSPMVNVFCGDDAKKANRAIVSAASKAGGLHVTVENEKDSSFVGLEQGDIFFLEGDENTPLGECYIGKIESKEVRADRTEFIVGMPGIDEVFDELHIDLPQEEIPEEEIVLMEAVDGVSMRITDDIAGEFSDLSDLRPIGEDIALSDHGVQNMGYLGTPHRCDQVELTATGKKKEKDLATVGFDVSGDSIVLDVNIDLAEVFGLKDEQFKTSMATTKLPDAGSYTEKVYLSATGNCYHLQECGFLSNRHREITLNEAVNRGYRPCRTCNPPVKSSVGAKLDLTGKIGLQDLRPGVKFDWENFAVQNLKVSMDGKFITEVGFESALTFTFESRKTEIDLAGVKLQGLREKMFPIAFLGYNFAKPVVLMFPGGEGIRQQTAPMPLTVAVVVYMDLTGKVSLEASLQVKTAMDLSYSNEICRDGAWVWEQNISCVPHVSWGLEAGVQGNADIHAGISAMVYVFNLNIIEVALLKVGGEAEGKLKVAVSSDDVEGGGNLWDNVDASFYARLYLKLVEGKINISVRAKLLNLSGSIRYDWILRDLSLAEFGKRPETYCDFNSMTYGNVTASDETARYFKNEKGQLQKEDKDGRTILTNEEFISICGIDDSYLYLYRKGENDKEICRIPKEGGELRRLTDGVRRPLTMDDQYLYYIPDFNINSIERINRQTLSETSFASFSDSVQAMIKQDGGYYIVTRDTGFFAMFFGGAVNSYYMVDQDGTITADLGTDPPLTQYPLKYVEGASPYYAVYQVAIGGILRDQAAGIYWMSADQARNRKAETASGWKIDKTGVFFTKKADDKEEYHLACLRAEDGAEETLIDFKDPKALFTLTQKDKYWYYFDLCEDKLALYRCDENFRNREVLKLFDKQSFIGNVNLGECSVELLDNTLFFYTMPDDAQTEVLYRYSI